MTSRLIVNSIRHTGGSADAVTLASDGTCTANITNNLSNRRLTINGAMQVCQRGNQTGISTAVNNYVTDRFSIYENGGAVYSGLHQDSGADLPEFPKCLRADCTTASTYAGTHESKIPYYFEGQDLQLLQYGTANNKKITLSFYVRSNQAATYAIWFYRNTGSRQNGKTYTINSANTWEKKTVTINGDATSTINNDHLESMRVEWILMAGPDFKSGTNPNGTWEALTNANRYVGHTATIGASTDDYFDITGVQLEVDHTGSGVATDFEHRSFAQELLLCQRYYTRLTAGGSNPLHFTGSTKQQQYVSCSRVELPTTMRAAPSISFTGTRDILNYSSDNSGYSGDKIDVNSFQVRWGSSSTIGDGTAYTAALTGDPNYVECSAEL